MKPQSKTLFVAAGSVLLTLIACAAPAQPTAASAQESSAIRWDVSQPDDGDGDPRLQLRAKQSTSSVALDGARAEFSAARDTLGGGRGPVSFSVVHAAGRLDCTAVCTQPMRARDNAALRPMPASRPRWRAAVSARRRARNNSPC